jgi:flagellar biosynthesis protein FlgN
MLKRALEELDHEVRSFRKLSGMLEEQFVTARRLDTASLARVSEAIEREVNRLDERSNERARLLTTATTLARRLPAARAQLAQRAVDQRTAELKKLATHCKAATLRNGQLLASQYDTMQRLLLGEKHTYAPG